MHRSLVGFVEQPLLLRVLLAREIRDLDLARRDRLLGSFDLSLPHQDSRPINSHLASECHKGVIRGAQWRSVALSDRQLTARSIRGHQRSSEVIRGHQWSSVVISGTHLQVKPGLHVSERVEWVGLREHAPLAVAAHDVVAARALEVFELGEGLSAYGARA